MKWLRVTKKTWIGISIFIVLTIAFLIFLLTFKVDQSIDVKFKFEHNKSEAIVNSNILYVLSNNKANHLSIRINNHFYGGTIKYMHIDETKDIFRIGINWGNHGPNVFAGTTINGKLLLNKETLWMSFFNHNV